MRRFLLGAGLAISACGGPDAGTTPSVSEGGSGGAGSGSVELGVPDGPDGLDFKPLSEGAELRLQTFGQGGTHLLLGVRCIGFGSRAFVATTLRNLSTGVEIVAPAPARPQLLFCEDDVCDLVPLTVMTAGLTGADENRDGLPIRVIADVRNSAGVQGHDEKGAVISTADL